jgi:hypothetical protein
LKEKVGDWVLPVKIDTRPVTLAAAVGRYCNANEVFVVGSVGGDVMVMADAPPMETLVTGVVPVIITRATAGCPIPGAVIDTEPPAETP